MSFIYWYPFLNDSKIDFCKDKAIKIISFFYGKENNNKALFLLDIIFYLLLLFYVFIPANILGFKESFTKNWTLQSVVQKIIEISKQLFLYILVKISNIVDDLSL